MAAIPTSATLLAQQLQNTADADIARIQQLQAMQVQFINESAAARITAIQQQLAQQLALLGIATPPATPTVAPTGGTASSGS